MASCGSCWRQNHHLLGLVNQLQDSVSAGAGRTGVSFDVVMKSGGWGDITKVEMDPLLLPLLLEKKILLLTPWRLKLSQLKLLSIWQMISLSLKKSWQMSLVFTRL